MAHISITQWFVVPVIGGMPPRQETFIIKAADKADALARWLTGDYAPDWLVLEPVVTFAQWCEVRDVLAGNELQYLLGLRDERTVPLGFTSLAT